MIGDPGGSEADRLADQRREDIERAAYERGQAAAQIAARLDRMDEEIGRHQGRLETINGSVRETGRKLDHLSEQIEGIRAEQSTRDKVNAALVRAASQAAEATGEKKLSRWQRFGIGATALIGFATFVVLIISSLNGGHL